MISKSMADYIKKTERLMLKAYLCPANIPTIGYGTTKGVTLEDVRSGRTITKAEAERMFDEDIEEFGQGVLRLCSVNPSPKQLDALVCFAYNVGLGSKKAKSGGLANSSLLAAHNRSDFESAARAFMLYNKARVNGKMQALPGLTKRRAYEASVYLDGSDDEDSPSRPMALMPQAVEPEKPMSRSTIAGAATVISGASAIGGISEVTDVISQVSVAADTVSQAKDSATNMGDFLIPGLLILVACLGAYIIWERYQMRQRGAA